ncbi:MAG: helix-turn-helix transcriptional regulator [Cryobacterium sp.]|nr:helix-turn-helix transcriptional regulator [Cryobacterium sp.]
MVRQSIVCHGDGVSQPTQTVTPFGAALRHSRTAPGLSQLALSSAVGTPSRHVSFLETGRSRPSREMVERISEALQLPLRERNRLHVAAGLAPAYPNEVLDSAELAVLRSVIDRLLASHGPYPAYVVDGLWNIVRSHAAATALLPPDGERNLDRLTYAGAWRNLITNWDDLAWPGISRLQADAARFTSDEVLASLVVLAMTQAKGARKIVAGSSDRVLCPIFRLGEETGRTVSVVAQFGSPRDVTLEELRTELFYPADVAADEYFHRVASER